MLLSYYNTYKHLEPYRKYHPQMDATQLREKQRKGEHLSLEERNYLKGDDEKNRLRNLKKKRK